MFLTHPIQCIGQTLKCFLRYHAKTSNRIGLPPSSGFYPGEWLFTTQSLCGLVKVFLWASLLVQIKFLFHELLPFTRKLCSVRLSTSLQGKSSLRFRPHILGSQTKENVPIHITQRQALLVDVVRCKYIKPSWCILY